MVKEDAHEATAEAAEEHADDHHDHHEVVPNPDYDGPRQHCLPPEVEETPVLGVGFALLMLALVIGAKELGKLLLPPDLPF